MLVVIGTICVPRVGRGGYSAQGRTRKEVLELEEVRKGVQNICLGRGEGRIPDD